MWAQRSAWPRAGKRRIKEVWETGEGSNTTDAIRCIPYLIENALAAMITLGPDDGKLYGDSRMAAMRQVKIYKGVSAKLEAVNFKIYLRQTTDDILWPPRYLVKETKARLHTNKFFDPLAYLVKTQGDRLYKQPQSVKNDSKDSPGLPGRLNLSICRRRLIPK